MVKRLQKKVLVLTLLFTILIQITMPMYVNAQVSYKNANIQTQIESIVNGTDITFRKTDRKSVV